MARATTGKKTQQAQLIKREDTLANVAGLNLDTVANKIAQTQVEVQKTLASLGTTLTQKLADLATIEQAIVLKQEDLRRLHDIAAGATTLDDLQAEIARTREEWELEQLEVHKEQQDNLANRQKQWQREEAEYQYAQGLKCRDQEDLLKAVKAQFDKDMANNREQLERTWDEREAALKSREAELHQLRAEADSFNDQFDQAHAAGYAEASAQAKREHAAQLQLLQKDAELQRKLADQQIASMNVIITSLHHQAEDDRKQLAQAHASVKEISAKALDSASGRSAMEALQQAMASQQAGSGKSGK